MPKLTKANAFDDKVTARSQQLLTIVEEMQRQDADRQTLIDLIASAMYATAADALQDAKRWITKGGRPH